MNFLAVIVVYLLLIAIGCRLADFFLFREIKLPKLVGFIHKHKVKKESLSKDRLVYRKDQVMIEVTRLYTTKKDKSVKKHAVALAPAAIAGVRSSTVLKNQKATIRMVDGWEVPVTETKQELLAAMGARVVKAAKSTSARRRA